MLGEPSPDSGVFDNCVAPKAMRIEREGAEPLVVPLYTDRAYVFGRSPDCTFVFTSDWVSRRHGQLQFDSNNHWVYRDLNSSNGTYLEKGTQHATPIRRASDRAMRPGYSLLLGKPKSRITFLAELPSDSKHAVDGKSNATRELERQIVTSALHRLPLFLLGPAGSGKTYVARAIHDRSQSTGQFVRINCGALPTDPSQLRSELVGHVEGAFTGAKGARIGRFEAANNGTLFLDEIESLPPVAQDLLLDVIEQSGADLSPLGSAGNRTSSPIRFRLIAASKKPLAQSGLRADLADRLVTGAIIRIPTLEDRAADIPSLVQTFLAQLRERHQIQAEIREDAVRLLQQASWPGQVRALEATITTVATLEFTRRVSEDPQATGVVVLTSAAIRRYLEDRALAVGSAATGQRKRPKDLTAEDLRAALNETHGNIERAAELLGVARNTLKAKLRQFDLA